MTKNIINIIPYLMPIAPALVLAVILYAAFDATMHWLLAVAIAVVLAVAFEAAIFQISHKFVQQAEAGNTVRAIVQSVFMIAAAFILVGIVLSAEQAIPNILIRGMLAFMPLLGLFVYLGQGMSLNLDAASNEAQEDKQEARRRQQIEWEQQQEIKMKREAAKIAAKYATHKTVATPVAMQHNATQKPDDLQQAISELLAAGVDNKAKIARQLNVDRSTVYRNWPETNGNRVTK